MELTGNTVLYPLAVGNRWTYRMNTGDNYTNSVDAFDPGNPAQFMLSSSYMNNSYVLRKDGNDI